MGFLPAVSLYHLSGFGNGHCTNHDGAKLTKRTERGKNGGGNQLNKGNAKQPLRKGINEAFKLMAGTAVFRFLQVTKSVPSVSAQQEKTAVTTNSNGDEDEGNEGQHLTSCWERGTVCMWTGKDPLYPNVFPTYTYR
ncbi:hypothetical protein DPEC_G00341700 [Dallia pectoralis]|uniref:Uncharacterized protein n=1 Tax=Dallia pectoralis TaxID=75939 RepID=A0ACC2F5I5_DALPE|nr:hypothetical protein DPEC_G00341700 [Dallia pectoralis]